MAGQFFDEQRRALDVLRMTDQDHESIITELERSAINSPSKDKRRNKRLLYKCVKTLTLEVTHPGGSTVRFQVKPRNISKTGLSVFHGGFVHTATPCLVPLRSLTGKQVLVRGKIAACRHIRGRVHELGIAFDVPIDLTQFLLDADGDDPAAGGPARPMTLPTLHGTVLVVDEWESDRKLLDYDLAKLGLKCVVADGGADALRLAQENRFDLVLTGEWLGDVSAADFVGSLRKLGRETPVVGVFADAAPTQTEAANRAGIATVLSKPYRLDRLAQLLQQFLRPGPAGGDAAADLSTKWAENGMRPMILAFLQGLEVRLADLQQQVAGGAADPLPVCLRLKSAAASYGFPKISDTADQLVRLLQNDAPLENIKGTIDRLIGLTTTSINAAEKQATD